MAELAKFEDNMRWISMTHIAIKIDRNDVLPITIDLRVWRIDAKIELGQYGLAVPELSKKVWGLMKVRGRQLFRYVRFVQKHTILALLWSHK